ncbi:MAG: PAS domain S-box protein [Candidatus Latescibacterota bacterium]|nr:MAG: PAS domain S-box protein [Candidatus Latescibacterota bacterium]
MVQVTDRPIHLLNDLSEELLGPGNLDEKLKRITDAVVEIFGADFARIWITRPGDLCQAGCVHAALKEGPHVCRDRDRCLHLMASSGRYTHIDGKMHRRVPFGCYKIGRVAAGDDPKFLTNDVIHDPRVHDHAWAEELGLVSFAGYRLVTTVQQPIGVLALFGKQPIWPETDSLLESVANTASRVIQSASVEEALENRLSFESLVSKISAKLISLPSSELDAVIKKGLREIGRFFDVERVVLGQIQRGTQYTAPYIWESDEIDTKQSEGSRKVIFPNLRAHLGNKGAFKFTCVDDIPDDWTEERRRVIGLGIVAGVAVPLIVGGAPLGMFTLQTVRPGRVWPADVVPRLRFVGEILANALNRKWVDESLQASESRYRLLAENVTDVIWTSDLDLRPTYVSPSARQRFDVGTNEPTEPSMLKSLTPKSRQLVQDVLAEELALESTGNADPLRARALELEHVREDGSVIWTEERVNFLRDENDQPIGLLGVSRDITERRRAEQAVRESNDRLQSVLRVAPVGIGVVCDRVIVQVNDRLCEMIGYTPEELLGKNARILYPSQEDYDYVGKEKYDQIRKQGTATVETRWKRKDGGVIQILLSSTPLDPENLSAGVTFTALDITARKKAERALRESEEKYRELFGAVSDAIIIIDVETLNIVDVNERAERVYGYSREEFLRLRLEDIAHEVEKSATTVREISVGRREHIPLRYHKKKDGAVFPIEVSAGRFTLSGRGVVCGVIRDITGRRRAEEERARLYTAIEQATEIVVITDADLVILYANPAFERITGFGRDEALGQKLVDLLGDKKERECCEELMKSVEDEGRWRGRVSGKKKSGGYYEAELTVSPVRDDSGGIVNFVAVKRDVSELVRLESQLRQAQKMEAIGTLAGGIAHDFNNILYAILGFTELAMDGTDKTSKPYKCLQQISSAGNRASELVSQILTFSRRKKQERKPLRVQSIVKEALKLLRASLPTTITVRQRIETEPHAILADPTEVHQIIMNLCTNAFHAMRDQGGILEVCLDEVDLKTEDAAKLQGLEPGVHIRLSVADTGHGMDGPTIERIYEPYFTTKNVGEGTGMGLATVHGIVKDLNGAINVESALNEGTRFDVFFPIWIDQTSEPRQEVVSQTPAGRAEHILLVDDEEAIAQMTQMCLEGLGYTVVVFTEPGKALEEFRKDPHRFDAVITDQTMPNLTGSELAAEMLRIRPQLPIILCTGFSDTIDETRAEAIGVREYIEKPITRAALATTISHALRAEHTKED